MSEAYEKASVSFSYRLNKDGTFVSRVNHVGMPHKNDTETSLCPICRLVVRSLEKLHSQVFHMGLNMGFFQPAMPTVKQGYQPDSAPVNPAPPQGGSGTAVMPEVNKSVTTEVRPEPTTEQVYE